MSRLVIVVASVLLAFPAIARADLSNVQWSVLTNDPMVTFTSDRAVECSDDGVTYASCTSPWRPAVGADGKHTFFIKDSAVPFSGAYTLDRTPPVITMTSGPADGSSQRERDATFTFTVTDAHLDHFSCSESDYVLPCDGTYAKHDIADGTYTVLFYAVDTLGNETRVTRTFTVVQPQVTHVDPKPKDEGGVLSTTASSPSVRLSSTHTRRWTRLHSLTLRDVEAGTAVKATCKGKGCPKRALRVTATKGTVSLAGLTGRKLSPGTVIKITLAAKGKVTRTFTIKIRPTRAPQIR